MAGSHHNDTIGTCCPYDTFVDNIPADESNFFSLNCCLANRGMLQQSYVTYHISAWMPQSVAVPKPVIDVVRITHWSGAIHEICICHPKTGCNHIPGIEIRRRTKHNAPAVNQEDISLWSKESALEIRSASSNHSIKHSKVGAFQEIDPFPGNSVKSVPVNYGLVTINIYNGIA